jgi:hypothetical protein
MLYLFGFDRVGVVVADLYFVDPEPGPGQEGAERGVRLELRALERGDLVGSIYSAQPIAAGRLIWRVDLLESVAGVPGSFDRTHHHPACRGWEPGRRHFVEELSADPRRWLAGRLSDLDRLVAELGADSETVSPADVAQARRAVPEILDAVDRLLERVRAGDIDPEPDRGELVNARIGWL